MFSKYELLVQQLCLPICPPLSHSDGFFNLIFRSGTNLAIIFGSRIVVGQLKQSVLPYLKHRFWVHRGMKEGCSLTRPEKELFLHEVDFLYRESSLTSTSMSATHHVHIAIFSFFCQRYCYFVLIFKLLFLYIQYDQLTSSLEDYAEIAIGFG